MKFYMIALATTVSATYLASTTRYYDGNEGACGCGNDSGSYSWQLGISSGVYTAAGSQALFDTDDATWCGGGCGKCYQLTSTGSSACSSCGSGETAGTQIIVMVTNLCPYSGNEQWCPSVNEVNQYGYYYHFDIMAEDTVFGDNPVVEFEPVTCPTAATTDFGQCECYGSLETDETPADLISNDTSVASGTASASTALAATSATSATAVSSATAAVSSSPFTTLSTSIYSISAPVSNTFSFASTPTASAGTGTTSPLVGSSSQETPRASDASTNIASVTTAPAATDGSCSTTTYTTTVVETSWVTVSA